MGYMDPEHPPATAVQFLETCESALLMARGHWYLHKGRDRVNHRGARNPTLAPRASGGWGRRPQGPGRWPCSRLVCGVDALHHSHPEDRLCSYQWLAARGETAWFVGPLTSRMRPSRNPAALVSVQLDVLVGVVENEGND
jgi:hypothetical protein